MRARAREIFVARLQPRELRSEAVALGATVMFAGFRRAGQLESAPILKRLEREHGFTIEGMEIFLQSAIDSAERKAQP